MRLEKIVLNGFKSFADKTDFVFDSSITAIVEAAAESLSARRK